MTDKNKLPGQVYEELKRAAKLLLEARQANDGKGQKAERLRQEARQLLRSVKPDGDE